MSQRSAPVGRNWNLSLDHGAFGFSLSTPSSSIDGGTSGPAFRSPWPIWDACGSSWPWWIPKKRYPVVSVRSATPVRLSQSVLVWCPLWLGLVLRDRQKSSNMALIPSTEPHASARPPARTCADGGRIQSWFSGFDSHKTWLPVSPKLLQDWSFGTSWPVGPSHLEHHHASLSPLSRPHRPQRDRSLMAATPPWRHLVGKPPTSVVLETSWAIFGNLVTTTSFQTFSHVPVIAPVLWTFCQSVHCTFHHPPLALKFQELGFSQYRWWCQDRNPSWCQSSRSLQERCLDVWGEDCKVLIWEQATPKSSPPPCQLLQR